MENILSIIAIVVSIVSIALSVISFFLTKSRDRKAATFDAFSRLQNEVFDKINTMSKTDVKEIANNTRDARFTEYSQYLARIEQYCAGVFASIYDFKLTKQIAGKYLNTIYEKSMPVIEKKRVIYPDEPQCVQFEKIVRKCR